MTDPRVRAAAELLTRYPFAVWHYGDSIGFEGLLAASDLLGDPRFEAFALGVVKGWIPRAKPYRDMGTRMGKGLRSYTEEFPPKHYTVAATRTGF